LVILNCQQNTEVGDIIGGFKPNDKVQLSTDAIRFLEHWNESKGHSIIKTVLEHGIEDRRQIHAVKALMEKELNKVHRPVEEDAGKEKRRETQSHHDMQSLVRELESKEHLFLWVD